MRQPVMYANSITGRISAGRCARTEPNCSASKNPTRVFRSANPRHVRLVQDAAVLDRDAKHTFQQRQLAVDLGLGGHPKPAINGHLKTGHFE